MRNPLRAGFTLIEMLVVMILLALLVGVVFPVIVSQVDDADPAKVGNDMANIRTAIEVFQLNVRPSTAPLALSQLAIAITDTDAYWEADDNTSTYSSGHVARWNGPYVDKNVTATTGSVFKTGFGGDVQSDLVGYDATADCEFGGGHMCTYTAANPTYLAVKIAGLEQPEAEAISNLIDGDETLTTGQFRWNDNEVASTFVAYYLAVPLK